MLGSRYEQATFLTQEVVQGLEASHHILFDQPNMPGDSQEGIL